MPLCRSRAPSYLLGLSNTLRVSACLAIGSENVLEKTYTRPSSCSAGCRAIHTAACTAVRSCMPKRLVSTQLGSSRRRPGRHCPRPHQLSSRRWPCSHRSRGNLLCQGPLPRPMEASTRCLGLLCLPLRKTIVLGSAHHITAAVSLFMLESTLPILVHAGLRLGSAAVLAGVHGLILTESKVCRPFQMSRCKCPCHCLTSWSLCGRRAGQSARSASPSSCAGRRAAGSPTLPGC